MSLSARPYPITTYDKTINIYVLVTFCTDTKGEEVGVDVDQLSEETEAKGGHYE